MRIGLFTDTYRPSINGIVFVVESLKRHLEDMGHEVYIFCPARSIRRGKHAATYFEDDHVVRFVSVKGAFFEDYDTTLFFPPRVLGQIRELDLDVIHFFTPGQVGLMGVFAGYRTNTPVIAQHCTDLYEFVEHYPNVLPGLLALIALLPFAVKINGRDIRELMKLYRPRRGATKWNKAIIESTVTLVYRKCDAVIALSRKSKHQLESWQQHENYNYPVTLLPNGVDEINPSSPGELSNFRKQWNIDPKDEVFGFVGRLGAEKNLAMLIPTLEIVCKARPKARLLFVGDFEYRQILEERAAESRFADRVTFTGALPREQLGVAYSAMDVFAFPSLTDTQAWVVPEAAHAGLPIVLIDRELSEVFVDGKSGYFASNDPVDMAEKIVTLFKSPTKRRQFGTEGKKLARAYSEKKQTKKLSDLYQRVSADHFNK